MVTTVITLMSIIPTCYFLDKFRLKLGFIHQTLFHVRWKQRFLDLFVFSFCASNLLVFVVWFIWVLLNRIEVNINDLNFFWWRRGAWKLLVSLRWLMTKFRTILNFLRRIRFLLNLWWNFCICKSSAMSALSFILGIWFY